MNAKEIIEGNKLIADFMPELRVFNGVDYIPVSDWSNLKSLQFNSSWDWLMPVIRKSVSFEIYHSDWTNQLHDGLINQDIDDCWIACVEFIKWYNKNK